MRSFDQQKKLGVRPYLTFVSTCQIRGRLYDLGSFPGAVPGPDTVYGELFRVRTANVWNVLDRYEGYSPTDEDGSLFLRRKVDLQSPNDQRAWVYWYNGRPEGRPRVPSGDWLSYVKQERGS